MTDARPRPKKKRKEDNEQSPGSPHPPPPHLRAPLASLSTAPPSYSLPDLPYDYDALAPTISPAIMQLHHAKHHNTYVTSLNGLLAKSHDALAAGNLPAALAIQPALRFHAGGHINHSIFWTNLAPASQGGGSVPDKGNPLRDAIDKRWEGGVGEMVAKMNAATAAVQGSGWGWLVAKGGRLEIVTLGNQEAVVGNDSVPLLGIDVWEHAYYLDYKNDRGAYLKNIWNVVNWANVSERYDSALKSK